MTIAETRLEYDFSDDQRGPRTFALTSSRGDHAGTPAAKEVVRSQRQHGRKKNIMKTSKKLSLSIKTNIKAGGLGTINHNRSGLKVRSAVKAGGLGTINHNRSAR
jgi:hypothetical protein